jgi:hypothetical protein
MEQRRLTAETAPRFPESGEGLSDTDVRHIVLNRSRRGCPRALIDVRVLRVDLASDPKRTAASVLDWANTAGRAIEASSMPSDRGILGRSAWTSAALSAGRRPPSWTGLMSSELEHRG